MELEQRIFLLPKFLFVTAGRYVSKVNIIICFCSLGLGVNFIRPVQYLMKSGVSLKMKRIQQYELRYFQVILSIGDPEYLLDEKAEFVMNKRVRYPDYLKIVDASGFEWVFDQKFTPYTASVYLSDRLLPTLLEHREIVYHEKAL